MYMNGIDDAPFDRNLGFSLNPVKNIQQVAAKVQAVVAKVSPPIVAKLSPTNIIAQQAAGVAKVVNKGNALALRAAQSKASTIYKATAASPLGKKLVTPMLDAGAIKSPIGRQLMPSISASVTANQQAVDAQTAQNAQLQKAADEQYQREYAQYQTQQAALDVQYAKDQAAANAQAVQDQNTWAANQSQMTSSGGWGSSPDYSSFDTAQMDTGSPSYDTLPATSPMMDIQSPVPAETSAAPVAHWWDWWTTPVKPIAGKAATSNTATSSPNAPVPAWDPYASISSSDTASYFNAVPTGANNMQLSNIQSSKSLPSGSFRSSGMGDIWGDLMTTGLTAYQDKTKASIAQSQAAQADATARIAASNAAAINAQKNASSISPTMIVAGVAAAAGLFFFMKKRRA
jgi:membrane-bound inhibitor of C-type lysozyme